jgi:hypothetical protein
VTTLGTFALGVEALAGDWTTTPPVVAITGPTGVVDTQSITATWSYTSAVSHPQDRYRVRVLDQDGSVALYDSGILSGTDTSFDVEFMLSSGTTYTLEVSAADLFDWSEPDTVQFLVEGVDANDFPVLDSVGTVYEIGINGVGYMLADTPERPYRRQTIPLDPPRFATSSTPFSEAIERYTLVGFSDWTGGAGQEFSGRPASSDSRYLDSEGINPFERDRLELLNDMTRDVTSAYTKLQAVVTSTGLYFSVADGELRCIATPGASSSLFTISGAAAVQSMTSDGTYWYYADGANVYRNNVAASAAAWSSLNAYLVEWCSDRIAVAYTDGSSRACLSTLDDAGAEEVAGGRFTFPGATITAITAGDGYLWFSVVKGGVCSVYAWQLGSDESRFVALTLPPGQTVSSLGFYLGNVLVRASETVDSNTKRAYIYRAVPSSGTLTAELVTVLDDPNVDHSVGDFLGIDRFVLFSWKGMTGTRSGVGCIDLSTGGWCKWLTGVTDGNNEVTSIVAWAGRTAFTVSGLGLYVEDDVPVASGTLDTSITDLVSGQRKSLDFITVSFDPLPADAGIEIEYTFDGGVSYTSAGSTDVAGEKRLEVPLGVIAQSVGLRFVLSAEATSPKLRFAQVRLHAISTVDQLVQLPINCSDRLNGLNGHELRGAGSGMARARTLEALASTRVRFQDVDYPVTRTVTTWEVVSVDVSRTLGVYDRHQGRQVQAPTAIVTLRRPL